MIYEFFTSRKIKFKVGGNIYILHSKINSINLRTLCKTSFLEFPGYINQQVMSVNLLKSGVLQRVPKSFSNNI